MPKTLIIAIIVVFAEERLVFLYPVFALGLEICLFLGLEIALKKYMKISTIHPIPKSPNVNRYKHPSRILPSRNLCTPQKPKKRHRKKSSQYTRIPPIIP
jgi:hypothetical protein